MIRRSRSLLTAAAGLCLSLPLAAQEPTHWQLEPGSVVTAKIDPAVNQKLADAIAEHLQESRRLQHYAVEVIFQDGTVELKGTVADQDQHDALLQLVREVPGVERIRDQVRTSAGNPLTPVQAELPPTEVAPPPQDLLHPYPGNGMVDPTPLFRAPVPGYYDVNPPKMPPYAWPTYAPYNNYSRVAYPELYPHQSWPFIGPLYPFPQVPLGWRSVKLEWQDGHWWLSRYATPHDWWLLKYW